MRSKSLHFAVVAALLSPNFTVAAEQRAPAVLPDRLQSYDPTQTNGIVFKEITKSNLLKDKRNWGKLVIVKYMNREYEHAKQSGRPLDADAFRANTNKMITMYNAQADLLDNAGAVSTRGFDYANLGVKVVGTVIGEGAGLAKVPGLPINVPGSEVVQAGAKVGTALGEVAMEVSRDMYVSYVGPGRQRSAQDNIAAVAFDADKEISLAYNNGMENEGFREGFNSTIALDGHAYIGLEANQNLDLNLEHRDSYRLERLDSTSQQILESDREFQKWMKSKINAMGHLSFKSSEMRSIADKLQENLTSEIRANTESIKNFIVNVETYKEREAAKATKKEQVRQLKYQSAQSTVFLISGLASLSNPDDARMVQAVGTATIQVAMAVEAFKTTMALKDVAGKALMGTLNLVAGIGGAIQCLLSALMPSTEALILEQIAKLAEQIRTLERNMHNRFDEVDRRITSMFAAMNLGFAEVNRMLHGIQYNQHEMKTALTGIESSLFMLSQNVYRNLKDGFHERVQEDTNACLTHRVSDTSDWYLNCLGKFVTYATHHAGNSLASGYSDSLMNASKDRADSGRGALALLNEELNKGVWNNINLIGGFLRWQYGDSSLLGAEGNPLVNLEEWSRYANDFSTFVALHPEFLRLHTAEIADAQYKIAAKGGELSVALNRLAQGRSHIGEPAESLSTLRRAIKDYEAQTNSLHEKLTADFDRFKSSAKQVDPTTEIDKLPVMDIDYGHRGRTAIHGCQDYKIPHAESAPDYHISTEQFSKVIPNEFKVAESMGLGVVEYCYDNVGWYDLREEMHLHLNQGLYNLLTANNPINPSNNSHKEFLLKTIRDELRRDPLDGGRYYIPVEKYGQLKERAAAIKFDLDAYLNPTGSRTYGRISVQVHMRFRTNDETIEFSTRHPMHSAHAERHTTIYALTRDDRGEMGRRYGPDESKWPKRNGLLQVWVAHNGFGLSKEQRGENADSLEKSELEGRWGGMMAAFAASSELLPAEAVEKSRQTIRAKIAKQLANLRANYVHQTISDLGNSGTLKTQVTALNGSLELIRALTMLTYPEAMLSDDALHAVFFGPKMLVGSGSILAAYENNDTFRQSLETMFVKNAENLRTLNAALDRLEGAKPGGEIQPEVHMTMSRMEVLGYGLAGSRAEKSIEEAIEAIKSQIAAAITGENTK